MAKCEIALKRPHSGQSSQQNHTQIFNITNMSFTTKFIATVVLASSLLTCAQAGTVTFYNPEDPAQNHGSSDALGSCGTVLSSSVPSAAINDAAWGSPNCGRMIAVRNDATGKCIEVPVLDRCASCAPDHVDLTQVAFNALFDTSVGAAKGSWSFGTCGSVAPPMVLPQEPAPVQPEPEVAFEKPVPLIPDAVVDQPATTEIEPAETTEEATQTTKEPQVTTTEAVETTEVVSTTTEAVETTQVVSTTTEAVETTQVVSTTTEAVEATQVVSTTTEAVEATQAAETSTSTSATSTQTPMETAPSQPNAIVDQPTTDASASAGLSGGAIAGIAIGSVAAVGAVVAGTVLYARRRSTLGDIVEPQERA